MNWRSRALFLLTIALLALCAGPGASARVSNVEFGASEHILLVFNGSDGSGPIGGVIADSSGALFGTTGAGGSYNAGIAFELVPSSSGYREVVLHDFGAPSDEASPNAGLVIDTVGNLYGTALSAGSATYGIIFKLRRTGSTYTESTIYNFADGVFPNGPLLVDSQGALYGTTKAGGAYGIGMVFKLSPAGSTYQETTLYNFRGDDGSSPSAGLTADSAGALYGTTHFGGRFKFGAVFKLTPSKHRYKESVIYSFRKGSDGAYPDMPVLLQGSNLFVAVSYGGTGGCCGLIGELTPTASGYAYSVIHTFYSRAGALPSSPLVSNASGVLFGTTGFGGKNSNDGVLYRLTPSGSGFAFRVIHDFAGQNDGEQPEGSLLLLNGALFGTTYKGGDRTQDGIVYEF